MLSESLSLKSLFYANWNILDGWGRPSSFSSSSPVIVTHHTDRMQTYTRMIGSLSRIKGKCWEFVLLSVTFGGRLPVGRHSGRGLPWPGPGKKLLVRMWPERGGHGRSCTPAPNELRENSWDFILIRKSILDSGISVWMWGSDLEICRLYLGPICILIAVWPVWVTLTLGLAVWTGLDNTQKSVSDLLYSYNIHLYFVII